MFDCLKINKVNRKLVSSSSIKSVGYDADAKILEVELRNGGIYQYFQVSGEEHEALITAVSIGRYYAKFIKTAHRFRRVK